MTIADQTVPEHSSKKMKLEDSPIDNDSHQSKMGGAFEAGPGYRGSFVGETMENQGFNERHKEQVHVTSRNLITRDIAWMSRGFLSRPNEYISQIPGQSNYYEDDSLRSEVINMYAPLFADPKVLGLLGTTTRPGYSKAKLNAIRVTINFSSYRGSWVEDGFKTAKYDDDTNIQFANFGNTLNTAEAQPLSHYIYRDRYDEYSPPAPAPANILPIPVVQASGGITSNTKEYRIKKFLENEVNALTLVHSGENFHFERKVNSKGAYYLNAATVLTVFATPSVFSGNVYDPNTTENIQTIINELEGLVPTGGQLIQQLGEGYNLLVVPASMTYIPVVEPDSKISVQPGIKTQMHMKCEADWFLYDYTYGSTAPWRSSAALLSNPDELQVENAIMLADHFKKQAEKANKSKRLNRKFKKPDTVFFESPKDSDFIKY